MITPVEKAYVEEYAYLPEHIVPYVTTISQAEPFLLEDFLIYVKESHLTFLGYPLKGPFEERRMEKVLDQAYRQFRPAEIALTAPSIPASVAGRKASAPFASPHTSSMTSSDHYYKLNLSNLSIPPKTRNMVRRGLQQLSVRRLESLHSDHQALIDEFMASHALDKATRQIFQKVPDYVSSVPTAWVFEARTREGDLVAFDVAEFGSKYYAMYMFNFISKDREVPGASDLLLSKVIDQAMTEQKRAVNLGLGINTGVTFFKTRWGGVPFFPHTFCLYLTDAGRPIDDLLQKL
jgi:hypothetical protein